MNLTINVDRVQADELIAEAKDLFDKSPVWLRWLAREALQRPQECIDLLPVDRDDPTAAAAGDIWVAAKPTQKFVLLVAALRAGNGQSGALVDFEHGDPRG